MDATVSNIHTPNLDRLANEGLRYNNFHTTAVCSATRASLLTGANHHEAGISGLVEMQTGCDNGYGGVRPEYATIAEILKEYDYATFCAGKWHLANAKTQAGPFDNWPLQKGFDRYYGFLHGENDQYHPHLVRDNSLLDSEELARKTGKEGYHFSADVVDNAIEFVFTEKNAFPDKPFFLYMAFGAMHTPHHAPKEYVDRYKGKFDDGWDAKRQQWFQRQKELGVIPRDAELTERNEYVDAWVDLSADQKKVYARFMEAYAGMLEYTDEQIGRFINYLEEIGELDNTIIVFLSDNGASAEGGKNGRFNAFKGQDIVYSDNDEEYRGFRNCLWKKKNTKEDVFMPAASILIKPTSSNCNIDCTYCFYKCLSSNREEYSKGFMSEDTLEELVKQAVVYAEGSLTFAFQGGEPMLAGIPFF